MSYVTEKTIWPAGEISHRIQRLIASFYELADIQTPDIGARMASEVFTADATLVGASRTFHGTAGS
jgi:hypothetical protein